MTAPTSLLDVESASWLEDGRSARTLAWVDSQRRRTQAHLSSVGRPPWVDRFIDEQLSAARTGTPRRHGGWLLREERSADAPRGRVVCENTHDGRRVVFEPPSSPPTSIRSWSASPGGSWLVVQVAIAGDERRTPLHLVPLDGDPDAGVITDVRHTGLSWLDDDRLLFVRQLESGGSAVVRRSLGEREEEVLLSAGPGQPCRFRVWHGRWVTVAVRDGAATPTRLWVLDLDEPASRRCVPIQPQADSTTLAIVDPRGGLLVLTDLGAPYGRLVRPGHEPWDRSAWRTVLEGSAEAPLAAVDLVRSGGSQHLVVVRKARGRTCVEVLDPVDLSAHGALDLPGPGPVSVVPAPGGQGELSLRYTDWITPPTELDIDVARGRLRLRDDGPQRPAGVRFELRGCRCDDGATVPYLWLGPEEAAGPLPTILTTYGGFGRSLQPSFSADNIAWVRAGGAVAVADVRGGGGHGTEWHRAGAGEHKRRGIDDLHEVARELVATGFARVGQIALLGASHGGLLVTAALLQRPELYAAGVAIAPFTDMLAYDRSDLGPAFRAEFGSSADGPQREALLGYSPCHNVRGDQRYPPLLLLAGENDTRVDAFHSRKLAHLLQQTDPEGGPFLLHQFTDCGHSPDALAASAELGALTLTFLAAHSGLSTSQSAVG